VIGPFGLNLVRVAISVLLFWLLWLTGKTIRTEKTAAPGFQQKHFWRFALCGLTGVALNQVLFIKGLTMTSTIHASLLMLCTPLLITLFAFWILKEKITAIKALGLAFGIGGAVLLVMTKEKSGTASLNGDLFILINAISYTIYFILVKPLMLVYSPLHVIRWVFTFGLLFILPFCWPQFATTDWMQFHFSQWLALIFIVLCGTFLAYSFNIYGIRHLGAGTTGSYIYTQPVFAAIIATFFLQEHFSLQKIAAGMLIFTGVFLVSRKKPPIVEE
jgi:drug/metabolite transporter (DMT)-like permease